MLCIRCNTPIPADIDEIAWVCEQCGQGQILSDERGLLPLNVQFSAGIPANGTGKPYWTTRGQVTPSRQTFKGDRSGEMREFWKAPRRFILPAHEIPPDQAVQTGIRLLERPPALEAGPRARFLPVVTPPGDVQSLVEFIILSIEAGRRDDLRELRYDLALDPPELWVLPE
jgi:hypothetical protein